MGRGLYPLGSGYIPISETYGSLSSEVGLGTLNTDPNDAIEGVPSTFPLEGHKSQLMQTAVFAIIPVHSNPLASILRPADELPLYGLLGLQMYCMRLGEQLPKSSSQSDD